VTDKQYSKSIVPVCMIGNMVRRRREEKQKREERRYKLRKTVCDLQH